MIPTGPGFRFGLLGMSDQFGKILRQWRSSTMLSLALASMLDRFFLRVVTPADTCQVNGREQLCNGYRESILYFEEKNNPVKQMVVLAQPR
jgi:hypothetical protein